LEPVTHFLTGACLGRAGFNRRTGLATLTLTLATEAPDIDFLGFLGGSVSILEHHRGFTHTLLGAPFVGALTLGTVYGIYRMMLWRQWKIKQPPNWKLLYLYSVFGCLVHILLDFLNNYGIRPFAPFWPRWYSWDVVFIIDPAILFCLFAGLVVPALFSLVSDEIGARKSQFRGRGGAITALVLFALLVGFRDIQHRKAVNALKSLTYHDEEPVRAAAFPNPVNPFLWNGVVETQDFFESVPVDTLAGEVDPQGTASIRYKPEETPVTLAAKKSRLGRVYLDWAQYPVVEADRMPDGKNYKVQFLDLRFVTLGVRRAPVLAGYVVLDPNLNVMDMYVGERK
jgi:inner membrane protein